MVYHWEKGVAVLRTKDAIRQRIFQLCEDHNLTVNALADRCGITQSTLSNITSGRNNSTTVATIKKICDGLGIELPEFFNSPLFRGLEQEIR